MEAMFYACLIVAGVQLLFCNIAIHRQSRFIGTAIVLCLLLPIIVGMVMISIPLFLMGISLICLMLLWKSLRFSSRSFSAMSLLSVCLFFGGCSGMVLQNIQQLREEFPVVSLSDRLPAPAAQDTATATIPSTTLAQEMDQYYDTERKGPRYYLHNRTAALTQLHGAVYYSSIVRNLAWPACHRPTLGSPKRIMTLST